MILASSPKPLGEGVPFNRPFVSGLEWEYLREAAASGHLSGAGPFTRRCEALLEAFHGCPRALLTSSCTHALEMGALLCELERGDELIVPAFTFVSTANAFALFGAVPRFADVREDTLNIDPAAVASLIGPRTKAIVVVHYAGVGCDMDPILEIAQKHSLRVIEDNAHGLFGRRAGRALGSFGDLSMASFHETKNLSCGEGGALVVNDPALAERAEILREKGTDRSRFFRGQVDKYTWVDVGSSYLMSDLSAAWLWAQLEAREAIHARRRAIWQRYRQALGQWAAGHGIRLPEIPADCEHTHHIFHLRFPEAAPRQRFLEHCRARLIGAVFHYLPLQLSPMGRRLGGREGMCPVAERAADSIVRLPLFNGMTDAEFERVIGVVTDFGK